MECVYLVNFVTSINSVVKVSVFVIVNLGLRAIDLVSRENLTCGIVDDDDTGWGDAVK